MHDSAWNNKKTDKLKRRHQKRTKPFNRWSYQTKTIKTIRNNNPPTKEYGQLLKRYKLSWEWTPKKYQLQRRWQKVVNISGIIEWRMS
mgnify:CR=1 FL=1